METYQDLQKINQPKKKIKVQKQQLPEHIILDFTPNVNLSPHKAIQQLIYSIFVNQNYQPTWIKINKNKKIEHIVYINIEIQAYSFYRILQDVDLSFLNQLNKIYKKIQFIEDSNTQRIWENIFTTEQQMKIDCDQIKKSLSYQETLYQIYLKYTLTSEQMIINNYPSAKRLKNSNFKDTIKWQQNTEIQFKNKIIAMDCQMVTTHEGFELARITIVNILFQIIYDTFVKPKNQILNHNTKYSGITAEIMDKTQTSIEDVHKMLQNIINKDTIIIGHSLQNDLNALKIIHQKVIDTAVLYMMGGRKQSLKFLSKSFLKTTIQKQTHDSVQDAKNSLGLAKLKIQLMDILEANQLDKNKFNMLRKIVDLKSSILIVDQNADKFLEYGVHCCYVNSQENANMICKKIKSYIGKNIKSPEIIVGRIQYKQNIEKQWDKYYVELQKNLSQIWQCCLKNTVMIINWDRNKKVRVLSPDSPKIQRWEGNICVFLQK